MIKLNDTQASSSLNVLAEGELDTVVGGCYHGRRGGWGHGYGKGWGRGHDKGYFDKGDSEPSYSEPEYSEPEYSDYPGSGNAVAVNNVDIDINLTINQVAVAG